MGVFQPGGLGGVFQPLVFQQDSAPLVSGWFDKLSEPPGLKIRSRRHALDQFARKSTWFGTTTSPFLRDWYRLLSEPVRRKPPLPIGATPNLFQIQSHLGFSFAITETGDVAAFSFAIYTAGRSFARVAITEIKVDSAQTTINEIRYNRGYS